AADGKGRGRQLHVADPAGQRDGDQPELQPHRRSDVDQRLVVQLVSIPAQEAYVPWTAGSGVVHLVTESRYWFGRPGGRYVLEFREGASVLRFRAQERSVGLQSHAQRDD